MRRGGLVELDVGAGAGCRLGGGGRLHHPDDLRGPEAVAEGDEADPGQEGQDRGEEAHGPELEGNSIGNIFEVKKRYNHCGWKFLNLR